MTISFSSVRRMALGAMLSAVSVGSMAQPYIDTTHAGTRWWWLGSAVDKAGLTWQMEQLASHGIHTVEITPLYGVIGNEKNEHQYLSPSWMEMLAHTAREGKRLGIETDMNLGTGWPFGGPTVPLSEAACKLVVVDTIVSKAQAATIKLEAPEKERPYSKLIARRVYPTKNAKESRVIALYEGRTRQKVKRAAPGGEGWVIDHFDSLAVAHYLQRFDSAFASYPKDLMPAVFFNDSYEVYQADWTPSLLKEFKKRRGYNLTDRLQAFVDGDPAVISDYRETLAELLLKNFTEQWVKWSHKHGVKVRNQAHGSPANLIDVYAAVDIPEIEGFGLSNFGIRGLRRDDGFTRKNFSDLTMLKYASSAAHISGKRLTSSETFTWLTEHFRTSLSQMKPDLDLMFCTGVNRILFHGTCYAPKDEAWPGRKFYASIDMSPTNTIWRDAPELTRYIATCQRRLQSGEPDNDFLVMVPIRNMWRAKTNQRLMMFDIHHIGEILPTFTETILKIDALGYSSDYISERYLLTTNAVKVTQEDGTKCTMLRTEGGVPYRALILPEGCILSPKVKKHIDLLKRKGAQIIYGIDTDAMGKVAKAEPLRTELGLQLLRRRTADGWQYFVANLTPKDVHTSTVLAVTGQRVDMKLRSGESCFVNARPGQTPEIFYPLDSSQGVAATTLVADLTNQPWKLSFKESQPVINHKMVLPSLMPWEGITPASLVKDIEKQEVDKKTSLSAICDSIHELAGTGVYETIFDIEKRDTTAMMRLDLGDVRESARVFINDVPVGVAWCVPFTVDFSGSLLREGANSIRIEVTNLPANRIASYDRRNIPWRKMKDINVVNLDYKRTTYSNWAPMPSGLNSTVKLYRKW